MKFTPIVIAVSSIACLSLGFVTGRLTSPKLSPEAQPSKTITNLTTKSSNKTYSIINPEQMARFEIKKSIVERNPAVVQLALTDWCKKDPEGALAFALENKREDLIYYCLGLYGRMDADSALAWIEQNTVDMALKNSFKTAVYQGLAKDDPNTAIDRVSNLPQGPLRNQILQTVVNQWAQTDVESVFDWIETQKPTLLLSSIYGQVMHQYIGQSPEEAISLISDLKDNNDKHNFARKAAFELGKKDPQKVLTWAESLNAEQRHAAHMGLMEQWGKSPDSLEALNYIKELPSSSENQELLSMLAMKMSHSSPSTLASEIPNLPQDQQIIAATHLAQAYSNTTPEEIIPWLDTLDSPDVRDAAVVTSLTRFRHTNVSQAFDLSASLNSYNKRRDEVQKTLLEWVSVNPQAAMDTLYESSLPEDLKDAIARNVAAKDPNLVDFLLPAK